MEGAERKDSVNSVLGFDKLCHLGSKKIPSLAVDPFGYIIEG